LPVGLHALVAAALLLGFGLARFRRTLVKPLAELRGGTERIARGAFGSRVEPPDVEELAALAEALNAMSAALAESRARTAEDLRRLEAANAELRRAQDALVRSEKLASVGRLAAGLAHELGNPLAAVRGYVEILAQGGLPEAEARGIAARAHADAERIHGLVRDLLGFARQDRGEVGEISIPALLQEAASTVRHQSAWKGIELRVHTTPATARGDAGRLHQVLVNLLLNAADAGARTVELGNDATGAIAVGDDGHGIAPEHIERLFEPFFTTRPVGKGTGLGLAVAWQIMAQHGGRIEVESRPGHGAIFRLHFDGHGSPRAGAGSPPG
jgi:signal transduction histidine kinase